MDPVTHAVIGLGTAALSGQPAALTSPIYIGAILGALAPDMDVVAHKNPFSFLKHHRGASHSFPGILAISGIIAGLMSRYFPGAEFAQCFYWTFLGALSHTLLDSLNSYGTKLWWPLRGEKWTGNLLVLFDPYLPLLFLLPFLLPLASLPLVGHTPRLALVLAALYLGGRYRMKQQLTGYLKQALELSSGDRVVLMPARYGFARWEFVIESPKEFILGKINYYGLTISEKVQLAKEQNPFTERALASKLGHFFRSFTPHLHLEYRWESDRHVVFFRDLRYMLNQNKFLHTATVIINDELQILASYLHAFREESLYPVEGDRLSRKRATLQGD